MTSPGTVMATEVAAAEFQLGIRRSFTLASSNILPTRFSRSDIKAGDAEYKIAVFSILNKNWHGTALDCGGSMLTKLSIIAFCSLNRRLPSSIRSFRTPYCNSFFPNP